MWPLTVVWRDAHFDFDYDGTQRDDYLVTTVGFLVEDGDLFLSIAQEKLPDGDFRGVTHIPKVLVQRIINGENPEIREGAEY